MSCQAAAALLLAFLALAASASLPKPASTYFKLCQRYEPAYSDCVKESITDSREKIVKGIPELELVPMDPLSLPMLDMSQGGGFRFIMKDVILTGLRNFQIISLSIDKEANWMNMTMVTPEVKFTSRYEMEGRILSFPIKGQGEATMVFSNVTTRAYNNYEKYKNKDKEYIRVKDLKWEIEPTGAKSYLTGLFNNDKNLGEATNRFLNENWKETFETFREIPEKMFGTIFRELSNRVLRHYPYDVWFPK